MYLYIYVSMHIHIIVFVFQEEFIIHVVILKAAAERKGGSFIVVSIPLFMITHEFTSYCYLPVNLNFKRRGKI